MIGCFAWALLGVAVYLFWGVDWRLGLGLVFAIVSVSIDVGIAVQQLRESIDLVNRKIG